MNPSAEPLEHQSAVIGEGRILEIGARDALLDRYDVDELQSRSTHALLPGFVDACARFDARASVSRAVAESLRAGITSFAAYGSRVQEVASTVSALHLHAVVGLPFTSDASSWRATELLWDEYRADPYVTFCFAPGSLHLLDDSALTRLRRVADELDAHVSLPLHVDAQEIADCVASFGARPIERAQALGLLRPGVSARHLSVLTDQDIERIAGSGICVVACPQADLRGHGSITRIDLLTRQSITCAVGSGDESIQQSFDILAEARLAGLLNGLDATQILALATIHGAQTIGLASHVGSIEPGKFADLVALDLSTLATPFATASEALNSLAFTATRQQITDVWLGGRAAIQHGRLLAFDEETFL